MLVCAFLCAFLHTRPRVQRAPGIPCSLFKGECLCKPRANRAARRRSYVRKWQRKHHTLAVVPDKRAQRAPIRDPYAVAVIIERAGGRLSLNDSGRWSRLKAGTTRKIIGRGRVRRSNPFSARGEMDCFAEPVIGRRFAPTRWLAMTARLAALLPPHLVGDVDRELQLRPLLFLAEDVALLGRGKASLRP